MTERPEGTVPYCLVTRSIIDHIRSAVPPHDRHSVWSHPYITAEDARRIRRHSWQMEPVNG